MRVPQKGGETLHHQHPRPKKKKRCGWAQTVITLVTCGLALIRYDVINRLCCPDKLSEESDVECVCVTALSKPSDTLVYTAGCGAMKQRNQSAAQTAVHKPDQHIRISNNTFLPSLCFIQFFRCRIHITNALSKSLPQTVISSVLHCFSYRLATEPHRVGQRFSRTPQVFHLTDVYTFTAVIFYVMLKMWLGFWCIFPAGAAAACRNKSDSFILANDELRIRFTDESFH